MLIRRLKIQDQTATHECGRHCMDTPSLSSQSPAPDSGPQFDAPSPTETPSPDASPCDQYFDTPECASSPTPEPVTSPFCPPLRRMEEVWSISTETERCSNSSTSATIWYEEDACRLSGSANVDEEQAKEEVETENLLLRVTKTVPVFEDGENGRVLQLLTFLLRYRNPKGKRERKERAAAADSCCGRSMSTNLASAEQPSDPGSTGPKWAAEEQHWVPLFNCILEVPTLVSSHVSRYSCALLRQRICRRQCQERDVAQCLESPELVGWPPCSVSRTRRHETEVPHKFFSNKRCRREFGNWCMNGAVEPPRSLLSMLLFGSCWDPIRCTDPMRMAIWQTSPLSSSCLFHIRFLDALVSVMLCLRACATIWRTFRAC